MHIEMFVLKLNSPDKSNPHTSIKPAGVLVKIQGFEPPTSSVKCVSTSQECRNISDFY